MLASRTSERICHRLNRVPNAAPAHTQARRAAFILKDAVASCRDGLRSFVALLEPCVSHNSSRNRHRTPRRTDIRTARRALLLFTTKHSTRDSTCEQKQPDFSFSLTRLADVCLPTGNPLSQGALDGLPWALWVAPAAQREAPRLLRVHGLHAPEHVSCSTCMLG